MNNEQEDLNFDSLVEQVIDAQTDDFFEVAKIFNLNPLTDFAGADLQGTDLSNKNLQGANFKKTNFSSANLSHTDLRGADLSYADLSGADLRNADLRGADLSYARVENAMFRNNQGIYERLRLSLIERGANLYPIIESEIPDNNMIAYRKLKEDQKWVDKCQGKYVIFVNGQWDGNAYDDMTEVDKLINGKYAKQSNFFKKVTVEEEEPIDIN